MSNLALRPGVYNARGEIRQCQRLSKAAFMLGPRVHILLLWRFWAGRGGVGFVVGIWVWAWVWVSFVIEVDALLSFCPCHGNWEGTPCKGLWTRRTGIVLRG